MSKINRVSVSLEEVEKDLMKDEDFRLECEKLSPRYEAISKIIKLRKEQGITQEELAKRIGTKKSSISRFESGNCNPSIDFLGKLAKGLNKEYHSLFS